MPEKHIINFFWYILSLTNILFENFSDRRRWSTLDTSGTGQKSEHRMGHTAVYDPTVRCIYLYGGSKNKKWFNDVHMLDVDEWKWQVVQVGKGELC